VRDVVAGLERIEVDRRHGAILLQELVAQLLDSRDDAAGTGGFELLP
jgi:hypothetical protein